MCDMRVTPEILEKLNAARAVMKANSAFIDESIAKLSPAAQEPARKLRDLVISEEDPSKIQAEGAAIKAGLSEEVSKELEEHSANVAATLGLMA